MALFNNLSRKSKSKASQKLLSLCKVLKSTDECTVSTSGSINCVKDVRSIMS